MSNGEYPKWVKRAEDIGPVLCLNAKEAQDLLNAWETEQAEKAQTQADAAKKLAAEAKAVAELALKQQGKGK